MKAVFEKKSVLGFKIRPITLIIIISILLIFLLFPDVIGNINTYTKNL